MPTLTQFGDLLLVVFGFGFIIFIHEMGHFLAARWAGVRVLAFAIGFGSALVSYRKGFGFRRGSSEGEYKRWVRSRGVGEREAANLAHEVSPTEYRLNALPLGGYVKMLGQDDSDPGATSNAPDSFTNATVPKRMVIISAGVIMNLISAAVLFVIVFSVGLRAESPRIGLVGGDRAAGRAVATGPGGERLVGLKPGDTVLSVGGDEVESFKDIGLAVAMSRKDRAVEVVVQRPGYAEPLSFSTTPTVDPVVGMLSLGIAPAMSGRLNGEKPGAAREEIERRLAGRGFAKIEPGMWLVDASSRPVDFDAFEASARVSEGKPMPTRWAHLDDSGGVIGEVMTVEMQPRAEFEAVAVGGADDATFATEHLLGLTPVMSVAMPGEGGVRAGLRAGDVFARIGTLQWPSMEQGRRMIGSVAGGRGTGTIKVVVLRRGELIDLGEVTVKNGVIGFDPQTTASTDNLLAAVPQGVLRTEQGERSEKLAASSIDVLPGTRLVKVGDADTPTLVTARAALQALIKAASPITSEGVEVKVSLELPVPVGQPVRVVTRSMMVSREDAARILLLGWEAPLGIEFFKMSEVLLRRSDPLAAIGKGLDETRKMVLTTYLTFARLFQGTVKVEHIKGPIGITQTGTILAERGFVWVLFFMAAVSINLAVVNFLPLPIVDGGHFCFLLWEQFTGRPVSPAVQNVAALLGLALIGVVFLVTTYNDLANLLWR